MLKKKKKKKKPQKGVSFAASIAWPADVNGLWICCIHIK